MQWTDKPAEPTIMGEVTGRLEDQVEDITEKARGERERWGVGGGKTKGDGENDATKMQGKVMASEMMETLYQTKHPKDNNCKILWKYKKIQNKL